MSTSNLDDRVPRRDWRAWHEPYDNPDSPLSRRLRIIQAHIDAWLEERPEPSLTVVSLCAGDGRDLLEILARRADAGRVHAVLVEKDERLAAATRNAANAAGLTNVEVRCADAGDPASFHDALPADLLLLAGVFGNISDQDVERTIEALPSFCSAGAVVIWTRSRRDPDLTPAIRRWFRESGFGEEAFHAPEDVLFSVGVHRFQAEPNPPLDPNHGPLFRFLV